jgi:hypothetical protein
MTIVRRQHNSRFASLPNAIWEDPRISIEAKGVLGYLLSRPHNWHVRPQQVGQILDVGKDKLQRIFQELISAGYVTREQNRDDAGSFGSMEYVVRDETVASLPQPENPQTAKPHAADPQPANPAAYKRLNLQKTESTKEAADDARASRPPKSLISPEAFSLADDLMRLQRIDRDDPRCIGMAYAVQGWLTKGWNADVIRQTVETVMARCTSPPRTLRYFEPAIAEAHAERDRPLPIAQTPSNTNVKIYGTSQNQSGVVAAARRLAQQFESRSDDNIEGNSASVLRLPAR